MQFRIADTFTDSLARLTGDEQKAVKTAAFDLQMNPAHPGLKLHQVDRAKDKDFWSVRVTRDIRLIVHRTASSFLLCYVDHHDAAYQWAERRRLERHPTTGAAQLVEIRETVREIRVPRYVEVDVPGPQAIGVFVRSPEQIERALSAVQAAGMRPVQIDHGSGGVSGSVAVGTMHLAKGLEFRAVAVAACDEEVIPLQTRIERVGDDADLEEVYGTERHLLYVACTRARDRLLVTGVDPGSEFLDDLRAG